MILKPYTDYYFHVTAEIRRLTKFQMLLQSQITKPIFDLGDSKMHIHCTHYMYPVTCSDSAVFVMHGQQVRTPKKSGN